MTEITGNTYPVRDKHKALGGRPTKRGNQWIWLVPDDKADEARSLLPVAAKCGGMRVTRARTCKTCGQRINYGIYCGKCEFS